MLVFILCEYRRSLWNFLRNRVIVKDNKMQTCKLFSCGYVDTPQFLFC
jgi:hypothetical protein